MKVRIVKCSDTAYWYNACTYAVIEVCNDNDCNTYTVSLREWNKIKHLFPMLAALYIQISDCEVIEQ